MSAAIGALVKPEDDINRKSVSCQGLNHIEGIRRTCEEMPELAVSQQSEKIGLLTLRGLTKQGIFDAMFGRKPFGLCVDAPPDLSKRIVRIILRRADTIVVKDDDLAALVIQAGVQPDRVLSRQLWDPSVFTSLLPSRGAAEAHRLVFAGELLPFSGAVDFQVCAARWAERHPERPIDITWVGEGDLHAVLDAHPLPSNMRQRFVGWLTGAALANVFGNCGLLAVPDLTGSHNAPLREAAAAGLPIIGSSRNHLVRQLVRPGETGWLIDPLKPKTMADALGDAMLATIDRLNEMRVASRARALMQWDSGFRTAAMSALR